MSEFIFKKVFLSQKILVSNKNRTYGKDFNEDISSTFWKFFHSCVIIKREISLTNLMSLDQE